MRRQYFEAFKIFVIYANPPPPAFENCDAFFAVVEKVAFREMQIDEK